MSGGSSKSKSLMPTVQLRAGSALAVVLVLAAVRGLVYTAASATPFQHTTSTAFTLVSIVFAAICSIAMYPPWSSLHRLTERDIIRLVSISALVAVCTCISVYTLRVIGPVRAAALEHLDLALVPALGFVLAKHRRVPVFRGAVLALGAALLVCWYDPGGAELAAHAVEVSEQLRVLNGNVGRVGGSPLLGDSGGFAGGDYVDSTMEGDYGAAEEAAPPSIVPTPKKRRAAAVASLPLREYKPPRERLGPLSDSREEYAKPPAPATIAGAEDNEKAAFDDGKSDGEAIEAAAADGASRPEGGGDVGAPKGDAALPKSAGALGRRLLSKGDKLPETVISEAASAPAASPVPLRGPLTKRVARGANILLAQAERLRNVIAKHERSSVYLAGAFLALGAWLNNVRRRLETSLAADTSISPRKLHALVLVGAALLWAPVAFVRWVVLAAGAPDAEAEAVGLVKSHMPWILSNVGDHSLPSLLWYALVAIAFAVGVMILGEHALDIHISGPLASGRAIGASAGGLLGQHTSALGGAAALPGLLAGDAAAASASISTVATAASTADTTLLRIFSLMSTVLSACLLSRATPGSSGETSSIVLWVGLFLSVIGLASAGGLDASQIQRLLNAISRTGSTSVSPNDVHPLLAFLFGTGNEARGDAKHGRIVPHSGGNAWRKVLKHIWEDKNSRRIFIFLTINFSFMFVEIIVGYMSNSLGLISDAGHMFFDNASLFIGLYASYMARWKTDERFTYGYARYEVLAGFVNAIFLVFVAISVVMEAVERLWEPPHIRAEHLLPVSVGGLLVNILGLIFFHDVAHAHGGHGHGGGECGGHSHGGTNENMYGVYLHVLADALGSVGVIISSLLIQWYGWYLADPVFSIIISGMIFMSVFPLIAVTIGPLLSRAPEHLDGPLADALAAVQRLPDVRRIEAPHFWKLHADTLVGSLHVIVAPGADHQKTLTRTAALFTSLGIRDMTVQVEVESTEVPEASSRSGAAQQRGAAAP